MGIISNKRVYMNNYLLEGPKIKLKIDSILYLEKHWQEYTD